MSKTHLLTTTLLTLVFGTLLNGQTAPCQVDYLQKSFFKAYPDEKQKWEAFSSRNENIAEFRDSDCPQHYVIPVVFHVYHDDGINEFSESDLQNLLDIANESFLGLNEGFETVNSVFRGIRGTLDIEFALAQRTPEGMLTNGINYYSTEEGLDIGLINSGNLKDYAWPNSQYLNIYIAENLEGAGGYATYPSEQRVSQGTDFVKLSYFYARGGPTIVHELGHWLNLIHVFEGGCESEKNDCVKDTPAANTWADCPESNLYCTHTMNVENFMSYSTCKKMFTQGQTERMETALRYHLARNKIWKEDNLERTGLIDLMSNSAPTSDFITSTSFTKVNSSVYLYDYSCGFPTEWHWTMPGGNLSHSNERNAYVSYSKPGIYEVSLSVSNNLGVSETLSKKIEITGDIEVGVYPNPILNKLVIDRNHILNSLGFELFDGRGIKIFTTSNVSEIDFSPFSNGVYFLKIIELETGQEIIKKLIVAK